MVFRSHFSDEYDNNASTTCEHMKTFIHWMYEDNLFIKDCIVYVNIYGCSKEYKCANELWLLSVLEFA